MTKHQSIPANDEGLELASYSRALTQARVLIVGDVMLDAYLSGDADRISPEAPVPVVRVDTERLLLGGAGNVARNISSLGGKATLIGVRGQDFAGEDLEQRLGADNISYSLLRLRDRVTTVKTRILARQQQVLRFDREHSTDLNMDETDEVLIRIADRLPDCTAVVISDYGKGVVTPLLMDGVRQLIAQSGRVIPLLVDPKPQNIACYSDVTILTPNAKETSELTKMPVATAVEIVAAGRRLMEMLNCEHLLTTLGSRGMAVFHDKEHISHIPTYARQVFDVTGAGDTVIATLAMGLACHVPLLASCLIANHAAGIVVGRVGAATVTQEELVGIIEHSPPPAVEQWGSL